MKVLEPITRGDFQALSETRLREAAILLANGEFEGAYYLAGYAVECALKGAICKAQIQHQFPPKVETVRRLYNHNIRELVVEAKLAARLAADRRANGQLDAYWKVAEEWTEKSRYDHPEQQDASALLRAITDPSHRVMAWIHNHW